MPWTSEQRAAKRAAMSPAQLEAVRAKERARYAKRKKKKRKPASDTVRAIFSRARSNGVLDAPPPPPPSPMIAMIDAALAADAPNVEALATREHYADAVDTLTARTGWRGGVGTHPPQAVLWACDVESLAAFRLASGLLPEAVMMRGDQHVRRDREWLRSVVDSEAARTALAMLGECDWPNASPRERAGYLLGRVVEARRAVVA